MDFSWLWTRKPVMQRSLRDDILVACAVLLGAGLGYLVLGGDDPGALVGSGIGAVLSIVGANVARRLAPRRRTRP